MEMKELARQNFDEAAAIVKEVTQETKLLYSEFFTEKTGNEVYIKPENLQRTGAYKVRGAYYTISQLVSMCHSLIKYITVKNYVSTEFLCTVNFD